MRFATEIQQPAHAPARVPPLATRLHRGASYARRPSATATEEGAEAPTAKYVRAGSVSRMAAWPATSARSKVAVSRAYTNVEPALQVTNAYQRIRMEMVKTSVVRHARPLSYATPNIVILPGRQPSRSVCQPEEGSRGSSSSPALQIVAGRARRKRCRQQVPACCAKLSRAARRLRVPVTRKECLPVVRFACSKQAP